MFASSTEVECGDTLLRIVVDVGEGFVHRYTKLRTRTGCARQAELVVCIAEEMLVGSPVIIVVIGGYDTVSMFCAGIDGIALPCRAVIGKRRTIWARS